MYTYIIKYGTVDTQRTIQIHGYLNIRRFLSTMCTIRSLDVKNIQMTSTMCYSSIVENVVRRPTSLTERLLRKIGVIDVQKYVITGFCFLLNLIYY